MPRYIWKNGHFRDSDGKPMPIPHRAGICMPMVQSDIDDYRSPIDGKPIGSRSQRRYDLEKNNCILAEPKRKPRGYINPKFALKRGLKLTDEAETKHREAK